MFCSRCGAENSDDAAFCSGCGNSLSAQAAPPTPEPTQVKVGKIRKCPACGASVNAFETACSACRHEFSGLEASRTIQALFKEIQDIEILYAVSDPAEIARQKSALIRGYPIPNSRDELLELLYFIQPKLTDVSYDDPNYNDWSVKFSEVVLRAKAAYKNDSKKLAEIQEIEDRGKLTKIGYSKKGVKLAGNAAGQGLKGVGLIFDYGMKNPIKSFIIIMIVLTVSFCNALHDSAVADQKSNDAKPLCDASKGLENLYDDAAQNARNEADRLDKAIANARILIKQGRRQDAKDLISDIDYKRCTSSYTTEDDAEAKFKSRKRAFLSAL